MVKGNSLSSDKTVMWSYIFLAVYSLMEKGHPEWKFFSSINWISAISLSESVSYLSHLNAVIQSDTAFFKISQPHSFELTFLKSSMMKQIHRI